MVRLVLFDLFYFILFHIIIDVIETDVTVTRSNVIDPLFFIFVMYYQDVWPDVIKANFICYNGSCSYRTMQLLGCHQP